MKIRYDDGPGIEFSQAGTGAMELLGREICRLMREADASFADCWTCFRWNIDKDCQPEFRFGGSKDDVTWSDNENWPFVDCASDSPPRSRKP